MLRVSRLSLMIAISMSNSSERFDSSRIMLCVQKNDAMREPRVIGRTWCRDVAG